MHRTIRLGRNRKCGFALSINRRSCAACVPGYDKMIVKPVAMNKNHINHMRVWDSGGR